MRMPNSTELFRTSKVLLVGLAVCLLALLASTKPTEAAFSGQNGKILFTSYRSTGEGVDNPEGDEEIFTINPDGTGLTQLTHNSTYEHEPAWSPAGTKIAFTRSDGHDDEIYTMPTSGGVTTQVTANEFDDHEPAWSPNGTKIAYVVHVPDDPETQDYDPEHLLYTIPVGGGTPTLVSDYYPNNPAWSPDGTKIAFSTGASVYTVPANGGTSTAVTHQQVWSERGIDWSPDGTKIAYVADDDEPVKPGYADSEIWVISASGGIPTDVTDDEEYREQYTPTWSPNGSKIAFTDQHDAIYTISSAGGTPTKVAEGLEVQSDLDWGGAPAIARPTSKAECKNGGHKNFAFKNQGQCIASVQRAAMNER